MDSTPSNAGQRFSLSLQLLNLKFVFLGHVSLASWIMLGGYGGESYLFHSSILVLLILYGIHFRENPEPLFLAVCIEALAFVLDLCLLVFQTKYFTFAVLMVLVHMVFRVVATIVLLREHQVRGGPIIQTALRGVVIEGNSAYDDIDQRPQPHIPVPRHATDMGSH